MEFRSFQMLRRSGRRYWVAACALLPPVAFVATVFWLVSRVPGPVPFWSTLAPLLLIVPLYLLLLYRLTRRWLARQVDLWLKAGPNQAILGEYMVAITEDGVTAVHGKEEKSWRWEQIWGVVANNDYGYIYTSPNQPIIIPKHCFTDADYFHLFMKTAVIAHWNKERAAAAAAAVGGAKP